MSLTRPISRSERDKLANRAKRAAARHMLADGIAFHDVRRATGLGLRSMPIDVIRIRTNSGKGGA